MTERKFDLEEYGKRSLQFRKEIMLMLNKAGSGHSGGSLSCIDILNVLYYYEMRHRPKEPAWPGRDKFIMSKGHASPALYVTLAGCGYFSGGELDRFRKLGSILQGHVHVKVPGVEFSTGSLGQGLSVAHGAALGARLKRSGERIYCLLGDGEMQEGNVWEALMTAGNFGLDNLCAVLDYNKIQENGPVKEIKDLEPLKEKLENFKWHAIEIDGHDLLGIKCAFDEFRATGGRPTFIIANTVKGKGVSFMEGQSKWHGKAPSDDELEKALSELENMKV
ncbi:MAG: transketolase [Elusimicrobia bacterium]|nr:transketolase [Elusimicrobiota bacterium]